VRDGARPETDGEVGVANIAVLEAIVQSSDTGRAVEVARSSAR
jgi:predicted dehydrogenase